MGSIPHDRALESGPAFLREGYLFVSNRCRRLGTDAFRTRLGGRPAVCMLGREAAEVFYEHRLTRRGGVPKPIQTLLQDEGSVQTLDGEEHRHRKELFLQVAGPDVSAELGERVAEEWESALPEWERRRELVLLPALEELLCRAVCAWAGVPLADDREARERTQELSAMIDGAGSIGPRNWRGHLLRRRTERWAAVLVERVRRGELEVPQASALAEIARHRDLEGSLLEPPVAAVELVNVLRPVVAVARFAVFGAVALERDPASRELLADGSDEEAEAFVQEVRRFYPFFPAVAGRVVEPFEWRGHRFASGRLVLLDLYGTNHDARIWDEPEVFRASRFLDWEGDPYTLVPQGGGEHLRGHRCPGEWATIETSKALLRRLAQLDHRLPPQDLSIELSRLPAQPKSGVVLELRAARTRPRALR
ncbi:MAG TPA: cytochrome P450 [Gaiellaceae bacterium]|nr:cytochrome P450 [Gaiellaceae bacterium]